MKVYIIFQQLQAPNKKINEKKFNEKKFQQKNGRGSQIRTGDFLVPNQTRYQLRYTPTEKGKSYNLPQKLQIESAGINFF